MTGLALRNPIAVLMICIGLLVFAGVTSSRMSIDTFPELTPPVLVIGTLAPGLGPKDVEKTISWRLEKYVSSTPGIDHVESVSRNGLSIIYVWLKWGTDLNASQTLVQAQTTFAMAAIPKSLGVLPPFVLQYDPSNAPVVQVVVEGEGYTGPQLYDYAFNFVEPRLEGISGVASAAPDGGRQRQINVVVDPGKAQARSLTAVDVSAAVARSNALLPSGEFISKNFDANVYTNGVPPQVATIGDAPIKMVGNKPVLIRDVARVEDSGTPPTQSVSVDGKEAVYLNVLRVPGGNTLEIVDNVKKVVASLSDLPPGVTVKAVFDQSTFVRTTYHGLKKEIIQALFLIGLVILVFLQSFRGTLIVSVAIPLSFAITLIVLYATGQTLNAFTLGGLTLAMGRLVDDAVVVLESIHRHQRDGMSPRQAALEGANAVALPVLASTLTTMAVLLPVILLAGLAKKLFAPLALTVAVAMIASYFVSMAVTPVACRFFLGHTEHGRVARKLESIIDGIARRYASALRHVLPFRFTVVIAAVVLVIGSGWAAARLPSTFFPEIDESIDQIYVRFAAGTSLPDATAQIKAMGDAVKKGLPKGSVELVIENLGTPQNARSAIVSPNVAPNTGYLRLQFTDPDDRKESQQELTDQARDIIERDFPGVEALEAPGGLVASVFANGYTAPLVVEIRGDDLDKMHEQAEAIAAVARTIDGVRDVRESVQVDYPELRVDTEREKAGFVGIDARTAAETTLDATLGNINQPSVWIDPHNGQSYYVVTSYEPAKVSETEQLSALPVRVDPEGRPVLLGTYANVHRSLGPIAVERNHLERALHVLMQTKGRDLGTTASDLETALAKDPKTSGIRYHFAGQVDLMRTTFSGLGLALGLAVMVVFMIMASQFKSLRLPFVMLFTIPVTLVGIVLALMAEGLGFSITALMGVLMVIGIAVSNGILLVDDANRRLREGTPKVEAIIQAARSRFVPIAMTSIATVIGLIPTALGLEHGSEANQPLALAVVGGLTSSTVLSLFLVPVMFLFFAPAHTSAADDDDEQSHPGAPDVHADAGNRMILVPLTLLALAVSGMFAGALGALVGVGGGILLVPILTLGFGVDLRVATATSLVAVVATSTATGSVYVGSGLANMRLGMSLEIATSLGGVCGGLVAAMIPVPVLTRVFAVVLLLTATLMLRKKHEVGSDARGADRASGRESERDVGEQKPGSLAGAFYDPREKRVVRYQPVRVALGSAVALVAGMLSGLLGIGGGFLKVPAMNLGMQVPLRAAAATSNFMIGVTAASSLFVYFARGDLHPLLAAPVALGVAGGSIAGTRLAAVASPRALRLILGTLMVVVAVEMMWKGAAR